LATKKFILRALCAIIAHKNKLEIYMLNRVETNQTDECYIWPWMQSLFSAVLPVNLIASSVVLITLKKEFFKVIPEDVQRNVLTYLTPSEQVGLIHGISRAPLLFSEPFRAALDENLLQVGHLLFLVAKERTAHQAKAGWMLRQNPERAQRLIMSEGQVTDAAGRHFKAPMSAFEYAFWVGDIHMCHMMLAYLDDDQKKQLQKKCQTIYEKGLMFTVDNPATSVSCHFDVRPLLSKLEAYITNTSTLINTNNNQCKNWIASDKDWLRIGRELDKTPAIPA
jgi:hypothetical protein